MKNIEMIFIGLLFGIIVAVAILGFHKSGESQPSYETELASPTTHETGKGV